MLFMCAATTPCCCCALTTIRRIKSTRRRNNIVSVGCILFVPCFYHREKRLTARVKNPPLHVAFMYSPRVQLSAPHTHLEKTNKAPTPIDFGRGSNVRYFNPALLLGEGGGGRKSDGEHQLCFPGGSGFRSRRLRHAPCDTWASIDECLNRTNNSGTYCSSVRMQG